MKRSTSAGMASRLRRQAFFGVALYFSFSTQTGRAEEQFALDDGKMRASTFSGAFGVVDVNDRDEALRQFGDTSYDTTFRDADVDEAAHLRPDDDRLAPLRILSSFPLALNVGGARTRSSWTKLPIDLSVPKPLWKKMKLGPCVFTLKTSEFVLNSYKLDSEKKLAVEDDSVAARTTFEVQKSEPFYASMSAIVFAETDHKNQGNCRKKLGDKRYFVGSVNLDGSKFTSLSTKRESPVMYQEKKGEGKKLFLVWNQLLDKIEVVDEAGIIPALESDIYRFSVPGAGTYFLGANAGWTISQK